MAKLDSLQLLGDSTSTFGSKALQQHLNELWTHIKREMMSGADQQLKSAATNALTLLIRALSDDDDGFNRFVSQAIGDTKWMLSNVQLESFRFAESLLRAVAEANSKACVLVLRTFVPLCLGQYSSGTSVVEKIILMKCLNRFMEISFSYELMIKGKSNFCTLCKSLKAFKSKKYISRRYPGTDLDRYTVLVLERAEAQGHQY